MYDKKKVQNCELTFFWTQAERGVCLIVAVKGLQDTLHFAMGAVGENIGMGALHAHTPSSGQSQGPAQRSTTQCSDVNVVMVHND